MFIILFHKAKERRATLLKNCVGCWSKSIFLLCNIIPEQTKIKVELVSNQSLFYYREVKNSFETMDFVLVQFIGWYSAVSKLLHVFFELHILRTSVYPLVLLSHRVIKNFDLMETPGVLNSFLQPKSPWHLSDLTQ